MSGLGVEYRVFEISDSSLLAQANGVLEELLSGPKEMEMTAFLNGAGKLTAVEVRDQQCVVSVDALTLSLFYNDSQSLPLSLYSIVDSLTELDGIATVTFVMEEIAAPGFEDSYSAVYEF